MLYLSNFSVNLKLLQNKKRLFFRGFVKTKTKKTPKNKKPYHLPSKKSCLEKQNFFKV